MREVQFESQPVELPAGFDLLQLHVLQPERYPCVLESVAAGPADARYDVVFACARERFWLDADFRLHGATIATTGFLAALDAAWERARLPHPALPGPPFTGGWFIFMAYELLREAEPGLQPPAVPGQPVAFAIRFPVALVRERRSGRAWISAESTAADDARQVAADVRAAISASPLAPQASGGLLASGLAEPDPAEFLRAAEAALRHIAAGDIFQANLARHWSGQLAPGIQPWHVYRQLRSTNPAPFAGLATFGDFAIASSSPERLVAVRGRQVETRPIAGTRARDCAGGGEENARRELLASAKERAEHVMLIDLGRNDLGRVCEAGSVEVSEYMTIESYAHVHHIVSNVRGRLRADVTPGALLRAVFPGGTITGCPKVRCMEIISQLERSPRGAYTGSMGYLNRDGSCDFNILIRSIVLQGRRVSLAAGSGIVADSDPQRELEETRAKARGMILALGE
jgi:anthranilate synthase component 1